MRTHLIDILGIKVERIPYLGASRTPEEVELLQRRANFERQMMQSQQSSFMSAAAMGRQQQTMSQQTGMTDMQRRRVIQNLEAQQQRADRQMAQAMDSAFLFGQHPPKPVI